MRISATQLESFRLFMQPDQEWMSEQNLIDTIKGVWKPNHKVSLGSAFGQVLEQRVALAHLPFGGPGVDPVRDAHPRKEHHQQGYDHDECGQRVLV